MAGHRHRTGRPKQSRTRQYRMAERAAIARTPEARLAAAYDWARSSALLLARRRGGSPALRDRALTQMAAYLTQAAAALDKGETP